MRKDAGVFLILLCIVVIMVAGCTDSTQNTSSNPTLSPKFKTGDIVAKNDTINYGAIILDYNSSIDNYTTKMILQKTDKSWGYFLPDSIPNSGSKPSMRVMLETNYTYLAGHISDPTSIKTIDIHDAPRDVALFKEQGVYQTVATPITVIPTMVPSITTSQDPILGEWSVTFARGGSAQMYFGADGSVRDCIEFSNTALATGTWKNIGGNQYTVTSTWVQGGKTSSGTYVLNTDSDTLYDVASPKIVFSRIRGGSATSAPAVTTSTPAASGTSQTITDQNPIVLSGTGDNVHTISIPKSGMYLISASATPVGHTYGGFSVYIKDTNGKGPDGIGGGLTFNEFVEPSYKGTKSAFLKAGKFVVSIESGCAYTITISPL